jgi:hypothetical protein
MTFLGPLSCSQRKARAYYHLNICRYLRILQLHFVCDRKPGQSVPGKGTLVTDRLGSATQLGLITESLRYGSLAGRDLFTKRTDSIEIHSSWKKLNLRLKRATATLVEFRSQSFRRTHDSFRTKLGKPLIAYGQAVAMVVKALCYKLEGRGFDSRRMLKRVSVNHELNP